MSKTIPALATALASAAALAGPLVEMQTSQGRIVLELYPDKAPQTVASFLDNTRSGFYNGTIFHRVIDGFMIQGGGFSSAMKEKPVTSPALPNEAANGLLNVRGTLAMARTGDPHSARAQFFINLKDNGFLDYRSPDPRGYGYAVFGKVKEGMEVVDKIAKVETLRVGPHENVPKTPVVIESAKLLPDEKR